MTLRDLRTQNHMTQAQLANLASVSRHAILRMEQHVYPTPLPNVINALAEITGMDSVTLEGIYYQEVYNNRKVHGQLWNLAAVDESIFEYDSGNQHPFAGFRKQLAIPVQIFSAIQFCIAFSIHPFVLAEYEEFKTKYPETISIALTQAGLRSNIDAVLRNSPRFNEVIT